MIFLWLADFVFENVCEIIWMAASFLLYVSLNSCLKKKKAKSIIPCVELFHSFFVLENMLKCMALVGVQ